MVTWTNPKPEAIIVHDYDPDNFIVYFISGTTTGVAEDPETEPATTTTTPTTTTPTTTTPTTTTTTTTPPTTTTTQTTTTTTTTTTPTTTTAATAEAAAIDPFERTTLTAEPDPVYRSPEVVCLVLDVSGSMGVSVLWYSWTNKLQQLVWTKIVEFSGLGYCVIWTF